jgi:predicted deacylase
MKVSRRALLAAGTSVVLPASARAAVRTETGGLARGTPFATPWFRLDSGRDGPTVVVVAGIHGNETAPPRAAEFLTRAQLRRGQLWVVPRANQPALAAVSRYSPGARFGDLNRNFPSATRSHPRGAMAPRLWQAVLAENPAWLLDLHEGWGFSASSTSMGSSVVCPGATPVADDCLAMATRVLAAVNAVVHAPHKRFTLLRPGPAGSLARAAAEEAKIRALVFETTWTQPAPLRIAQQLLMVRTVLVTMGMGAVCDSGHHRARTPM